jgi:hypothetical protein
MLRIYLALLLGCAALPALANDPASGCVEVEVAGRKEQSFACLGEKLLPPPGRRTAPPAAPAAADAIAQRPANQLGIYNRAALEHRMGNAFGKSVTPQRPPPATFASPLIPGH